MRRIIYRMNPARQRSAPGEMNATEKRYAAYLQSQLLAGHILSWAFEDVTFTLAHNVSGARNACTYTPDFRVRIAEGDGVRVIFTDVKAFWKKAGKPGIEEDAKAKMKIVAELFPDFEFYFTWEENGRWEKTPL
jgi:hypothetical protein